MDKVKRWYDKTPAISEILMIFKEMSSNELEQVSFVFFNVVNTFKRKIYNQQHLRTLGAEKVTSYYKAYQKRRWYDKNTFLRNAIMYLNIMTSNEKSLVLNEFIGTLKSEGLEEIYMTRKKGLKSST